MLNVSVSTYHLNASIDTYSIVIKVQRVLNALAPSASFLHGNVVSPHYIIEVGRLEVVPMLGYPPRMVSSHWYWD